MMNCRGWCDRIYKIFVALGSGTAIVLTGYIAYSVLLDTRPPLQNLEEPGHFVDRFEMPVRSAYPGETIYLAQMYCHESSEDSGEFIQGGRGYEGLVHYVVHNQKPKSLPPFPNIGKSGCWQDDYRLFRFVVPEFLEDSIGETVTIEGWIEYWRNPVQKLLDAGVIVPMMKYELTIEQPPDSKI